MPLLLSVFWGPLCREWQAGPDLVLSLEGLARRLKGGAGLGGFWSVGEAEFVSLPV